MSVGTKLLQAAAGNAGDPVYVDDLFATTLWNGTGANQSVVNGIDLNGEGGLLWTKRRDAAEGHLFVDNERGDVASVPNLSSNSTSSAYANSDFSSFNSNGFSLRYAYGSTNTNGGEYVSWAFRKQEKFFDIVTWTGDGNSSKTISHNLGSTPAMMIMKRTNGAGNWIVRHNGINNDRYLMLNSTGTHASYGYDWSPTTTTFTAHLLGGADYSGNTSGDTYIAYLFANNEAEFGEDSDEAIIKCGSYEGNGSTGQFINLGFEPQFLLIKSADTTHDWYLADAMRGMANTDVSTAHRYVYAQTAQSEEGYSLRWRTEANGFHLTTAATGVNGSNNTYVYVAIRRSNKPASEFAATDLFVVDESDTTGDPKYRSTFPVDLSFDKWATQGGSDTHVSGRLLQGRYVRTNSDVAAANEATYQFDYMNGFHSGSSATSGAYAWMFRRAKGFFDVVAYRGDGILNTYAHNLGVTPELKIIKNRGGSYNWVVGGDIVTGGTSNNYIQLNDDGATTSHSNYWKDNDTASVFSVRSGNNLSNANGVDFIALLFATANGISKVGTYTGTGNDLNIDCGFSAGARLVLIKRTDNTGDWYLWDSVRGIVAGNDYYILLNTTDAQNSSYDYIDPLSSGFTVTSSAPAALNNIGGSYLFLAIA